MSEPIPAATVVVVRDGDHGLETLMLRRNSKHTFGGMWVFPGGRVDPEDADPATPEDELAAARRAAVREAREEAALDIDPDALVVFSHWMPPPQAPVRFSTWFFLAPAPAVTAVVVDGTEIHEHAWLRPADAAQRRDVGEIELAPPTWVTLWRLAQAGTVAAAIDDARARDPERFETHMVVSDGAMVALWSGDAAYDDGDLTRAGPRHRLWMRPDAWSYERS